MLYFFPELLIFFLSVNAQKELNIDCIFSELGKLEGSILVELHKDVLGNHTHIHFYKSLTLTVNTDQIKSVEEAVTKDVKTGRVIFQSAGNGKVETASYCLEKLTESPHYEYILFSVRSKKMTLMYIKGQFQPHHLDNELNKLKNLFITVNNKRIKLK